MKTKIKREKNVKDTTRMSLYIDGETKKHLEVLSKKYQRSKNNLITFLVNREFENSIDIDTISNQLSKVKGNGIEIDRAGINEAVYGE